MTGAHNEISDVELTAYLDGQATPELSAQIDAALQTDPALPARLEALTIPMAGLKDAFDLPQLNAPDMPEIEHISTRSLSTRILVPAALAASFALGVFVNSATKSAPDWVEQVALYQTLYVTETLSGPVQDSDLTQVAFTRAKEGLGLKFDAAPAIDGMTFKRAQMLAIDGAPLVQIAYLDDAGQPWALCITKAVEANAPVSASSFHDLATASWVKDGLGYVLVGGSDTTRVTALAESLTDRL